MQFLFFSVLANAKFVMNAISLGVSIEKLAVSVHLIYQSATFWGYTTDFTLNSSTFTGYKKKNANFGKIEISAVVKSFFTRANVCCCLARF